MHKFAIRACTGLALAMLVLTVLSTFCCILYQQPPGVTFATVTTPGAGTTIKVTTPAGKFRARLLSGSLIISNGDVRSNAVKVTLGYMKNAGFSADWLKPQSAWGSLARLSTWRFHFYREHFQVHLLPLALALLLPQGVHWWITRRPRWACKACGYDLRGSSNAPCPECGAARPPTAA